MGFWAEIAKKDLEEKIQKRDIRALAKVIGEWIGSPQDPERRSFRRSAATALKELAASAPGETRAAHVEKVLVKELKNEDRVVRNAVVEVLDKVGWEPPNDAERINYLIAAEEWDGLAEMGKPAVKLLISCISCLEDIELDIRVNVARTLGKIGDAKAIKPLLLSWEPLNFKEDQILWHDRDTLLPVTVEALTRIGNSAMEQLLKAVKDAIKEQSPWFVFPAVWALCEIGNRKASEAVIDWLFLCGQAVPMAAGHIIRFHDFDKRLLSSADFIRSQGSIEVLQKLLGDYADLILDIFTWRPTTDPDRWDMSRCDEAVRRLCEIKTFVSSNILHTVTKIRSLTVSSEWFWDGGHAVQYLDFKSQKQMAKEELKRRGKPRYDPSAYLNQDAWRL